MIAVIAGNYEQYIDWLRSGPRAYEVCFGCTRYIAGPREAVGHVYEKIVRVGTWWERPDLHELEERLRVSVIPSS